MKQFTLCLCALVALSSLASAQLLWGDDFENTGTIGSPLGPYVPGPVTTFGNSSGGVNSPTNGGWDAWYETAAADGGISTSTALGTQSLEVSGAGTGGSGCDMVQWHQQAYSNSGAMYDIANFTGHPSAPNGNGGIWQYRAMTYVPGSLPTGSASCYFITNNVHNNTAPGGPTQWTSQVQFNHATGTVADDQRSVANPPCIQYDAWVELVATFDLTNNRANITYGGQNAGTGPFFVTSPAWNPGTGAADLANLDCFTISSAIFFDNITLTKLNPPGVQALYETNNPDSSADISAVQGNAVGRADSVATQGQVVSLNYSSAIVTGGGLPFDAVIVAGSAPANGTPGTLTTPAGQVLNIPLGSAFWLSGVPFSFALVHPTNGATLSIPIMAPNVGLNPCAPAPGAPNSAALNLASIQYAILSPNNTDGIDLSQPVTLWVQG